MIRIAVLCNDRLGIPAFQLLVQNRMVVAAGTSDRSPEMILLMKQMTEQSGVPSSVFPKKNLEAELSAWLLQFKPDVVLVKTFPYKIPASVLRIPKFGFINFHYAPLPEFRGSNPLFWMIKEGVAIGGVSIHRMDENFDTGPILLKADVPISPEDSFGYCATQLGYAGMQLTGPLIQGLLSGNLSAQVQAKENIRWYRRPLPSDFTVEWKKMNSLQLKALANACNPWLKGAVARLKGWSLGITVVTLSDIEVSKETIPGTILCLSKDEGLVIACAEQTAAAIETIYT